jgi:hypothetical protein
MGSNPARPAILRSMVGCHSCCLTACMSQFAGRNRFNFLSCTRHTRHLHSGYTVYTSLCFSSYHSLLLYIVILGLAFRFNTLLVFLFYSHCCFQLTAC